MEDNLTWYYIIDNMEYQDRTTFENAFLNVQKLKLDVLSSLWE